MSRFNLAPRIVKQEADYVHRESPERAEPRRTNGVAEPRPIDILELLSKAKEEYQRVRMQTHMLFRFFLDEKMFRLLSIFSTGIRYLLPIQHHSFLV